MDKTRPVAERVRPILQAMERSIDAARQRRLHEAGPPAREASPVPTPTERQETAVEAEPATRLKARPKRPSPLSGYEGGGSFRSRAS